MAYSHWARAFNIFAWRKPEPENQPHRGLCSCTDIVTLPQCHVPTRWFPLTPLEALDSQYQQYFQCRQNLSCPIQLLFYKKETYFINSIQKHKICSPQILCPNLHTLSHSFCFSIQQLLNMFKETGISTILYSDSR